MRQMLHAVALTGLLAQGCYSHQVAGGEETSPRATEPQRATSWSYVWGAVERHPEPDDCHGPGLAETTYRSNLGYQALTVLTLGFVSAATVEWQCAAPDTSGGDL